MGSNSVTSIDTVTPVSETFMDTASVVDTISNSTNTVTTILPVPTANVEIIPNPDLLAKVDQGVQTITNPMFGKD
jgi:hypothetical protein